MKRILNAETLTSHGNRPGRRALVEILEAGLQAADPYRNTRRLLRLDGNRLVIGDPALRPAGSPQSGDEVYDLAEIGRIYVLGAGKGVQRVAKAIEDALGDRLTGGHVIAKHGDEAILERIGVTYGAHPLPDEGCVEGGKRILSLAEGLRREDLVFTIAANGISSLLTLPAPGVSLEDVRRTTYLMQVERGVPTLELNPIRNHLDIIKGGRLSAYLQPARAVHLVVAHAESYEALMQRNVWLHNLPECSTFADAVRLLKKWEAWEAVPAAVRAHLERADPRLETVKPEAFAGMRYSVYAVMPLVGGMVAAAQRRSEELGFRPYLLAEDLRVEAGQAGQVMAEIARTSEVRGAPFAPPCALFTSGEVVVTVGRARGIGGRNQEYALAAAQAIAGSERIAVGAVDSDGTDGPGAQFARGEEGVPTLAGGVVDGQTLAEAEAAGIDVAAELRRHNSTPVLWRLGSGIVATQGVSLNDLQVALVVGDRGGGTNQVP